MKGVIFTAFEHFVIERWGEDFWDELLETCVLKTSEPYVGPGTYPDEDLVELVSKTAERTEEALPDVLRAFGRRAFSDLARSLGDLRTRCPSAADVLRSVDTLIHSEVRKLWPEAETPAIHWVEDDDGRVSLRYESRRRLCPVFEGLVAGLADYYGVAIDCIQTDCTSRGAEACVFQVRFES